MLGKCESYACKGKPQREVIQVPFYDNNGKLIYKLACYTCSNKSWNNFNNKTNIHRKVKLTKLNVEFLHRRREYSRQYRARKRKERMSMEGVWV